MRKILALIMILLILAINGVTFSQEMDLDQDLEFENFIVRGTVLEASEIMDGENEFFHIQEVKLRIDSGERKGTEITIENAITEQANYDIIVKQGQKVSIMLEEYKDGTFEVYIADYYLINSLVYIILAFIILVVVIGKWKGIKSLISLVVTIGTILFVMLPLILKGLNPILVSVVTAVFVTVITIFLVGGINNKTIAAIIGTSFGVVSAGIIAFIFSNTASLTGLSAEESMMLLYIPQGIQFNFRHLLFAGIIMGALGAAMDVGISISSSIHEIHYANPELSKIRLFKSGMNVGRDIMGTMINTLILAYVGTSIPILLVFMAYNTELNKVFNLDIIATEVVRSLAGSMGLILTIPITALIATNLIKSNKSDKHRKKSKEVRN
ncbi:MAG: YibE/F family protein [Tissierellia bacterium]|nr:YibE/F family protein [Tissierellia bacterium]